MFADDRVTPVSSGRGSAARGPLWRAAVGIGLATSVACALGPTRNEIQNALDEGRHDEALAEVTQLVEQGPDDPRVQELASIVHLAVAKQRLAKAENDRAMALLDEAADHALEVARLMPEMAGPHVQMGVVSAYLGDLESAREHFRRARLRTPPNPIVRARRATCSRSWRSSTRSSCRRAGTTKPSRSRSNP